MEKLWNREFTMCTYQGHHTEAVLMKKGITVHECKSIKQNKRNMCSGPLHGSFMLYRLCLCTQSKMSNSPSLNISTYWTLRLVISISVVEIFQFDRDFSRKIFSGVILNELAKSGKKLVCKPLSSRRDLRAWEALEETTATGTYLYFSRLVPSTSSLKEFVALFSLQQLLCMIDHFSHK